jgi:phospho-N-acetylmuramoyl-pentapeptide-transferase
MLYQLLYPLHEAYSFFNIFKYITFRTLGATLTALLVAFIVGPWFIKQAARKQFGQAIRDDGPQSHLVKAGTPTMGGIVILIAVIVPTLLWADLTNKYIWLMLGVTVGYGLIGFWDDYLKVARKNSKGISARMKIFLQAVLGFAAAYWLFNIHEAHEIRTVGGNIASIANVENYLYFPILKKISLDLGWFFVPFTMLVIVGASNAVNLTDGLDGLAIGPVMICSVTLGIFVYVAGHKGLATYLQIPFIPGCGELAIFCGAMAMAGLGFLWYNTYPAQVFMGDIGSLSLGAAIGTLASVSKNELVLIIAGGIFVLEALSVITQVLSYKLTGKRIFRMAPLHHHFELKGWAEPKVIVRFWIISILLAIISLATLKIR